jgi:hypothetical protein
MKNNGFVAFDVFLLLQEYAITIDLKSVMLLDSLELDN